ncbi:hypothetical protein [Arenibaculum sp.]|jgi:hypothetical protein|uniref:hypothetical protein n=1 Tax=Arenibaculum sp. TaxID=2865862 RepID=UPI002E12056D|nr:hypothetical protein [Arenibaculum sp.]
MQRDVLIAGDLAAFLEGGVSIVVSSSGGEGPTIGRALGCVVSPDRCRVTVFLSTSANAALVAAVAATGVVAVVFTEPSTNRSVQLKGADARIAPPEGDVGPLLSRHVEAFRRDLELIGFDEAFTRVLMAYDVDDFVALSFTPRCSFDQTPGARAGSPLAS